MPHKDLKARSDYNRRYREKPGNKAKATERSRKYWATPGNKERSRESKQRWLGLPEPSRPRPERCECCNRPPDARRTLHLDHDHETGKFRGWLCHHCNTGIGLLGDNQLGVSFALAYLAIHG